MVARHVRHVIGAGVAMLALPALSAGQTEYRSFDGSGNNPDNPDWGARGAHLLRLAGPFYSDGIEAMAGEDRPNPREISNAAMAQPEPFVQSHPLHTQLFVFWGQFLDHDLSRSQSHKPSEFVNIPVPPGDPFMDPGGTGFEIILFTRSQYDTDTGTDVDNPREQINDLSAFIDASQVYGSWSERADFLRQFEGGWMLTSSGGLLPFNDPLEDMDTPPLGGVNLEDVFLAGDDRANEVVPLTVLHTLFVREHNRVADELAAANPDWDDETVFQEARRYVGALMQSITYNEWLPILLGENALPEYTGYDPTVNAGISNEFSTAAFRFGHTTVVPEILRLEENGQPIPEGHLSLFDAFFSAHDVLVNEGGIEPVLRGLTVGAMQQLDRKIDDQVRNFLFELPTVFPLDLASLNIQRGRDHGLGSYNETREALGLGPVESFEEISSDPDTVAALSSIYETVDQIDLWVGGLSEDPVEGALVGPTFHAILVDQFTRSRDGDRFWYQNDQFPPDVVEEIEQTTLADVILRNTDIVMVQRHVFHVWPDFNTDGELNVFDVLAFQGAILAGDPHADMNKDGALNIFDFLTFQGMMQLYL